MISTSQKEHLTYTLILQSGILLAVVGISLYYILPGLSTMSTNLTNATTAIDAYKKVDQSGFTYQQLGAKIANKPEYAELSKIIQADPQGTTTALGGTDAKYPKKSTENYLSWVKNAIINNDTTKQALILQKAKLNSILPNLNPINGNMSEKYISLKEYVRFIETNILKKFHFNATSNIGMQTITFGNATNGMPATVGMFQFQLDFDGTNGDIIDFIKYVNTSGNPQILIDDGTGTGTDTIGQKEPEIMSNPLITVGSFSIGNTLDPNNRTGANNGRITLNFYVRGGSQDDITYLQENLKSRRTALENNIAAALKDCKNNTILCASYGKRLDAFSQKYIEFSRSVDALAASMPTSDIYGLSGQANTMLALENEFNAILPQNKN